MCPSASPTQWCLPRPWPDGPLPCCRPLELILPFGRHTPPAQLLPSLTASSCRSCSCTSWPIGQLPAVPSRNSMRNICKYSDPLYSVSTLEYILSYIRFFYTWYKASHTWWCPGLEKFRLYNQPYCRAM